MLKDDFVAMVQEKYTKNKAEETAMEYLQHNHNKKIKNKIKMFWKEWGISKEEFKTILGGLGIFGSLYLLYVLGSLL